MSRAGRTGGVDPLDSLNLDDMFADGGDALFDGLDMDLGNMDDFAGSQKPASEAATVDIMADSGRPKPRTKRKSRSPGFVGYDNDEDYSLEKPSRKKRKAAKATTKKKAATEVSPTRTARGKKGKAANSKATPAGRSSQSRAASASSSRAKKSATVLDPSLQREFLAHPAIPESSFCGISPSIVLFYPFMPNLPPEPSMKNRKVFATIDRIHASIQSHAAATGMTPAGVTPAHNDEPIVKLMLECFQEEKAKYTRDQIGNAVGATRKLLSTVDNKALAGDVYAMASLLQRQYEFLYQNSVNMERYCMENFGDTDYAEVYAPMSKRKAGTTTSLLSCFRSRTVRVRVSCKGFKDPKSGALVAILPASLAHASESESKTKTKSQTSNTMDDASVDAAKLPVLTYAQKDPLSRRQDISERLSVVARVLESRTREQSKDNLARVEQQQVNMRKSIESNNALNIVNTAGLWKWMDQSGLFDPVALARTRASANGVMDESLSSSDPFRSPRYASSEASYSIPLVARIQSLLVEEDDGESESDDDSDVAFDVTTQREQSSLKQFDLSKLDESERAMLSLRQVGLVEGHVGFVASSSGRQHADRRSACATADPEKKTYSVTNGSTCEKNNCEVTRVAEGMISDLKLLNKTNSARFVYLEGASGAFRSVKDVQARKDEETKLINRCQQLLKRTQDKKMKNGKPKSTKEDLALPW